MKIKLNVSFKDVEGKDIPEIKSVGHTLGNAILQEKEIKGLDPSEALKIAMDAAAGEVNLNTAQVQAIKDWVPKTDKLFILGKGTILNIIEEAEKKK